MMRPALHPPQPLSLSSQLRVPIRSKLACLGIFIVLFAPLLCPQFCALKHWAAMQQANHRSPASMLSLSSPSPSPSTDPMHSMTTGVHAGHSLSAPMASQSEPITCHAPMANPQPLINEFKQAIQAVTECITAPFALVVFWHWLGPISSPRLTLRLAALLPPLPPPRHA